MQVPRRTQGVGKVASSHVPLELARFVSPELAHVFGTNDGSRL